MYRRVTQLMLQELQTNTYERKASFTPPKRFHKMAKKILMSVNMRCEKCRSAALKIGGQTTAGVTFVGLEGKEKDQVVVIGEGIDAAGLVLRLRKKVGFADLISVTDVDTS
ncbi:unnamed protein product [Brassica oleracea var. botrytis]|uniref:(rape) hypothetical protein n=3 Tax=Brassica TaxID=3705 RepID=A0A078G7E1_BRANA|nr:unnamed protein product [Brassica napus]CDY21326.1 BnaC03g30100D [Brassica napus]